MEPKIKLVLPPEEQKPVPATSGASWVSRTWSRIMLLMGSCMNKMGFPGAIQNVCIYDSLSQQHVEVHVGVLFTKLTVNGRDYYFSRYSGKFNGTGSGAHEQKLSKPF